MIAQLELLLQECNVSTIVSTVSSINKHLCKNYSIKQVSDIRSATFEALGISKMKDERVALLLDERYISNIYTAITEAWFQHTNILIVTVNGNLYQSPEYLDRCIYGKSLLTDNHDIKNISKTILQQDGPFLLRTSITTIEEDKIDYSSIIAKLKEHIEKGAIISLYNPSKLYDYSNGSFRVIKSEHKYCVVSKYVGNLLGEKDINHILCIPEHLLSYDSNIFNFRNLLESFYLIILGDNSKLMERLVGWITTNGITVQSISESDNIVLSNKTVIYIKG